MSDPTRSACTAPVDRAQQVRDTALSLFVQEGFGNVSLRQLGKQVGVQAGSLYQHVESKQALLYELIEEHLEGLVEVVIQRSAKAPRVLDKLQVFVRTHLEFQRHQQECAQLLGLELRSLHLDYKARIRPLLARYRDSLTPIIAAGITEGVFTVQDVDTATSVVLGMLRSIAFWFREGRHPPFDQVVNQVTQMVMGALGAGPRGG
ncbi:TetR family transcriptional regulator [Pseudomonas sp. M47T1]|uniref:TetR/AcrR family transcriptional regulator n=1 Tax=Pseudomonas TaxID=286 RepID=UPI000260808C|nr:MULTISPECIES: TetR/AcrR family transcriptional regulator [Pseudomonas]EIK93747.1 TetR family transcriptional regulator [Pseudomonas sp. M47T1]